MQLEEALQHPIDAVLLDNMAVPELKNAVARAKTVRPAILCEASGGVRLVTVRSIAETGVDMISVGGLPIPSRAWILGSTSKIPQWFRHAHPGAKR